MRAASLLALLALSACGGGDPGGVGTGVLVVPELMEIEPQPGTVLQGTRWLLRGEGFLGPPAGLTRIIVDGAQNGQAVRFAVEAAPRSGREVELVFTPDVLAHFPSAAGPFEGTLEIETRPTVSDPARSGTLPVSFLVTDRLVPELGTPPPLSAHAGARIQLEGGGFLLDGEGSTTLRLDAVLELDEGNATRLSDVVLPLAPFDRTHATLTLAPDVVGIRAGRLVAEAIVENLHESGAREVGPVPVRVEIVLEAPRVDSVAPHVLRRGQIVSVAGAGFVEADAEHGTATLLLLDGIFVGLDGEELDLSGPRALVVFPDRILGSDTLEVVLRVHYELDGTARGLGSIPGIFTGLVTPWIIAGADEVFGTATSVQLQIRLPRQIVFVKILPGFDESLETFGLAAARDAVLARMLDVTRRDYEGVNIEFRLERPTDFAEYTVVELGGRDPNGADLLGLDNTAGKDVGNLRFNDVIGGLNALSEAQGFYAYGGVFLHSFLQFSASHELSDPTMASERFDDIFAPLMPDMGGTPAAPGDGVPTARSGDVVEAVRVLGNLLGNTVSHEVGHALGLVSIEGRFHNEGDNEGWIMDAGPFRPFAERAEIDGQGPEFFSPKSRTYLLRVLPGDP